jgi:hypothetical protein
VQRQGQARHHFQAAVGLEVEHGGGADHPQRQQPGGQIARAEQDEQDPEADVQRAEQVLKREAPAGWTSCESIAAPAAAQAGNPPDPRRALVARLHRHQLRWLVRTASSRAGPGRDRAAARCFRPPLVAMM